MKRNNNIKYEYGWNKQTELTVKIARENRLPKKWPRCANIQIMLMIIPNQERRGTWVCFVQAYLMLEIVLLCTLVLVNTENAVNPITYVLYTMQPHRVKSSENSGRYWPKKGQKVDFFCVKLDLVGGRASLHFIVKQVCRPSLLMRCHQGCANYAWSIKA